MKFVISYDLRYVNSLFCLQHCRRARLLHPANRPPAQRDAGPTDAEVEGETRAIGGHFRKIPLAIPEDIAGDYVGAIMHEATTQVVHILAPMQPHGMYIIIISDSLCLIERSLKSEGTVFSRK